MSIEDGSIHVLHVDDEPDLADTAADLLERADDQITVTTAPSASDSLEDLSRNGIDCVVSDYDMPGMNGIEFLETVRETHPDLPFILFTGKGSEEIASEAISAGVTDYLQKQTGTGQYTVLANRITNAVAQYRSEHELEVSQRHLSMFFEHSPFGVIQWDENVELVRMNDAAEEILGYPEDELEGHSWETIVPDSATEDFDDFLSSHADEPGDRRRSTELKRKDGERIRCEWYTRSVTDSEADVTHFSQFQDITTEYRRQQRRERQQEALVDLSTDEALAGGEFETAVERITETAADVLDVSRVNVWLFDQDRETLTCVDHFDRRASAHERGMELVADDYPAYFAALENHRAIAADDARRDDRTAELAEDYLDVHDVGALLDATLWLEGEMVGVVCHEHVGDTREWTDDEVQFAGDIADFVHRAKRNEERVQQRREMEFHQSLLKAQQEAVPDGMLVVDEHGETVSYNDQLVDQWDVREETVEGGDDELLTKSVAEQLVDPDAFRARVEYLQEHPGETIHDEIELDDGRVFDGYSTPLTAADGSQHGRLWMFRDITERTDREHRIEALHDATRQLMTAKTREDVVDITANAAKNILNYPQTVVRLRDGDLLEPVSVTDEMEAKMGTIDRPTYEVGQETAGLAFARGETLVYDDVSHIDDDITRSEGASMYVPIGDEGVMTISGTEVGAFDGADIDLAEILAANAAAALARVERERRTEALHRATRQLMRAETEQGAAEIVAEKLKLTLDYPVNVVRLVDEDGTHLRPVAVTTDALTAMGDRPVYPIDGTPAGDAYRGGEPVVVDDVQEVEDGFDRGAVRSAMYLPLGTQGTVSIADTSVDSFDQSDVQLASILMANAEAVFNRVVHEQELRRQNERLDEFASIVAHDLRNPLNVLRGSIERVEATGETDAIQRCRRAAARMDRLIEDLLAMARRDDWIDDVGPVDLVRAVENCWPPVGTVETTLRTELGDDYVVYADEGRVNQLLENLFRNAVEHGGEDVTVTVGRLADGFYVSDDGPGVPDRIRDEVFDFGVSTADAGTGLGLAIVEEIVEAHDWAITVSDSDDGGARIEITGVEFAR